MKVVVTGSAGYIGGQTVLQLKEAGHIVIGNDWEEPSRVIADALDETLLQDFASQAALATIGNQRPDAIIHCAANFANQNSIDNIHKDMSANILGTINLLEAAKNFKTAKFIYLSSSCVYTSEESSENILNPSFKTPYAISKFSAEQYVSFYNYFYKINASIFRLYNFYGPFDYVGKYRNVIPNFINKAFKNKTIEIHGAGKSTRDFTYVLDFVKVIEKILLSPKKFNHIYNFGASKKIKIISLAKKIIKMTHSNSKIKFIPIRKWDKFSNRKAKNNKLMKNFKNFKFTKIDHGLKQTVDWFKDLKDFK